MNSAFLFLLFSKTLEISCLVQNKSYLFQNLSSSQDLYESISIERSEFKARPWNWAIRKNGSHVQI